MSFADALRRELADVTPKKNCCRRALCAGLLLGAECPEKKELSVCFGNEVAAGLAIDALTAQFAKTPTVQTSGKCGHRYWTLSFASPAAWKLVQSVQTEAAEPSSFFTGACDHCASAFLRGAFIGWGTVNDPQRSFHLEWILPMGRGKDALSSVLEEAGYPPKCVSRPKGTGLYYKDSGAVEDLITLMGAHHLVFDVINNRIEREIRNNENRATNCVAKNIEKSISAAAKQIEAINRLMEKGELESLPMPLRETAELRYRNPDATLDELTAMHSPVISRSGLNHRLQKLLELAQE